MATTLKTKTLRDVPAYTQAWIISNIKPNPKRAGCAAHERFAKLNEGMKLEDAKIVLGKHFAAEMAWNVAREYFDLVDPTATQE
jgi:hypothetical protein